MNSDVSSQEVLEVMRINYNNSFPAERKVMDYVMRHPQSAINCNVSELAKASGTSDATVVRMVRLLGYSGYSQFRLSLAMDLGKKSRKDISAGGTDSTTELFDEMCDSVTAVGKGINRQELREAVALIKNANCVHVLAIGNTSNISQYMGFRLEKLGIRSTYYREPIYMANQIRFADERDVLIAISKSGASSDVLEGAGLAREKNIPVISITACANSPLAELSDHIFLSNGMQDALDFHKTYSYLNEMVIVDALLSFIVNDDLLR